MTYSNSITKKTNKNPIYIFWHTYLADGYEEKFIQIISRQLSKLISSKILNYAKEINVIASPKGISLIKKSIYLKEANHFLPKFKFSEIKVPYHEGVTLCKIKEGKHKRLPGLSNTFT